MKKAALRPSALGFLILAIVTVIVGVDRAIAAGPAQVETATFQSPADGSEQKTLVYLPPGDEPVPLLVGFHTWSGDFMQDESAYAEWCIARGWAMLHPDLRGPANRPEAAGSGSASGVRIPWQRPALRLPPGPPEADERRTALTVFRGGHEIVHEAALSWLEAQRRGATPDWQIPPHVPLILARPATVSGM